MDAEPRLVDQILAAVDRLPPMPQSVAEVMQLSRSDDFGAGDLAEVVCRDPTLAARVLTLCNSGFFGLSREVTSVHKAVLLLGFEMTKNLVFSSFVHSTVQTDVGGYAQTAASLWEHSFGVATASLALATEAAADLTDEAYTAGLLHDIGKVALTTFVAQRMDEVLHRVKALGESFSVAEQQVLGTTHAEVGGLVADRWKISAGLQDAIRYHHQPRRATEHPRLTALVGLADGLCGILGIGAGLDATDCGLDPGSLQLLGLDGAKLEAALAVASDRALAIRGTELSTGT